MRHDGGLVRLEHKMMLQPGDTLNVNITPLLSVPIRYDALEPGVVVGAFKSWNDGSWHLLTEAMMDWPLKDFFPVREMALVNPHGVKS